MPDQSRQIVISGLTKSFGSVKAVDRLSFNVEPGAVTGFLGPNGAGKTTTLRMLLGLVTPDSGKATIGGSAYVSLSRPSSVVGAALESTGFHPARSGRSHLRVYCTVNGFPSRRADEVLHLVGLSGVARRSVGGYSLGMRQRLALATALLGDPPVLILDEPANGLDPEGIAWMRRLMRQLADDGRSVLISSHVLSEIQQLVDRVVIINRGQLVRHGTLAELSSTISRVLVRTPQRDELVTALHRAGADEAMVDRKSFDTVIVTGMPSTKIGHVAHTQHIEISELTAASNDLEQIFLALTDNSQEGD